MPVLSFLSRVANMLAGHESMASVLTTKRGGLRGSKLKQYLREQAPLWTIDSTSTVGDALQKILEHRVGALIVVEPTFSIAGIVTDRDLLKFMRATANARYPLHSTPVSRVMTPSENVVCVLPQDTRQRAIDIMKARGIRHLPVVDHPDKDRHLVGIVSVSDFLQASPSVDHYKNELHPEGLVFASNAQQKAPEQRRVITKWTR